MIQPIQSNAPIVNSDGRPSAPFLFFINQLLNALSSSASTLAQQAYDLATALVGRKINTGTGLQGGGDLSADRTLSLTNTGVTAGTYGDATHVGQFTVNAQGQLTAAANIAVSGGGGTSWDFSPPLAASLTAFNTDGANPTFADMPGGLMISSGTWLGTGDKAKGALAALPSGTTHSVVARLKGVVFPSGATNLGIVLRESTTGKRVNMYARSYNGGFKASSENYSGATFQHNVGTPAVTNILYEWIRIDYNIVANTIQGFYSDDGNNWYGLGSATLTSQFTVAPNQYGLVLQTNTTAPYGALCPYLVVS